MTAPMRGRRLAVSLAASVALHVLGLAALWHVRVPPLHPSVVAIPIALVAGGGGGPDRGGTPAPGSRVASNTDAPPTTVPPPARQVSPSHPRRVARVPAAGAPAPSVTPPGPDAGTPGAGAGGTPGGGGGAGGEGSGGGGTGEAGVAYGANPAPPYPLVARRLGMEGVVLLEVVVGADGRPTQVRVAHSSGYPPLDEAAARTVRERWRFVPAEHNGKPLESRVTVPIRFELTGTSG